MSTTIAASKDRIPRRDYFILPLISLLTIVFLLVGSEGTARVLFPEQKKDYCEVADAQLGFRYRPGCSTHVKAAEGPWVVNDYNDCGYRSKESCKARPAGTIRISLIGSSIAEGWLVGYDQSFATRTAVGLTARCRRPVEVQNLGRQLCSLACIFHRVDEALALKPDLLLLTLNASDIDRLSESDIVDRYKPIPPEAAEGAANNSGGLVRRIKALTSQSRAVVVSEHFLFQDPSTYLRMALLNPNATGFLKQSYNPAWEEHLRVVDILLGETAEKARAAGVPFALVAFPSAAQAAALNLKALPAGIDPQTFNDRLAEISAKHGIYFVNTLDAFRHMQGSNKLYYLADGHLNGDGQALISNPLVEQLTQGSNPALPGCQAQPQQEAQ